MERGLIVFGILFGVLPLLLAGGALALPAFAFAFTLAIIVILSVGFFWGIAFVDVGEGSG